MATQTRLRIEKGKTGKRIVVFIVLVVVLGVTARYLEKKYGIVEYLTEIQATIKEKFSEITPLRGTVYDRNFKQLAVTMERVSVYVRTREIDSIAKTVHVLGSVLSLDEKKLQDQLENGPLRIWIAEDISQSQEVILKKKDLPGIYLQKNERRFYPNGFHAAHIIGFVENNIGLSGVEYYYDRLLANKEIQLQNTRQSLPAFPDLVLTVDLKIQVILEQLVQDIGRSVGAKRVASYIVEGQTGEIVAGAQIPGFDPNSFTRYSHEILENMFLDPIILPDKFRLFLRDAALLYANGEAGIARTSWSLSPPRDNLGGQLRLMDKLGLGEKMVLDFGSFAQDDEKVMHQVPVFLSKQQFGLAPESAAPLNILTAFSFLLNGGHAIHPFVVKEIVGNEITEPILLHGQGGDNPRSTDALYGADDIENLFQSQAIEKDSHTLYFEDDVLVNTLPENRLSVNKMMIAKIPAGLSDLFMLVVVEYESPGPQRKGVKKMATLEQIVEKRVERISVLQQVAKSVADVVEPDIVDDLNYPLKQTQSFGFSQQDVRKKNLQHSFGVMPDLEGLSLRKSLRLLQGIQMQISFSGTGRVISQSPRPGTSLRGISKCVLLLEKDEDMQFENFSRELSKEN